MCKIKINFGLSCVRFLDGLWIGRVIIFWDNGKGIKMEEEFGEKKEIRKLCLY